MRENNPKIANIELIKVLLDDVHVPACEIEAATGVDQGIIIGYRAGLFDIGNMSLSKAIKLTTYAEKKIDEMAYELLEQMKFSDTFDYVIRTDRMSHTYLKNSEDTYQRIFNSKEKEHHYGVIGDLIGGQLDNKTHSDEEIVAGICQMLRVGDFIPREKLENLQK